MGPTVTPDVFLYRLTTTSPTTFTVLRRQETAYWFIYHRHTIPCCRFSVYITQTLASGNSGRRLRRQKWAVISPWLHVDSIYSTIQCNTMQYNAIQCNTMQYNTMQYNAIQCNTMQYNAIQCNTIQYNAIQDNAIQDNAIQYISTQFKAMQCNTIQCNTI